MHENLIERYLTDRGEVRGSRSNVAETSFYPPLERLLSDIGKNLSPKVRCVINLADRGAGLPDGGPFFADQFRGKTRSDDGKDDPFPNQNPSRGVIGSYQGNTTADFYASHSINPSFRHGLSRNPVILVLSSS